MSIGADSTFARIALVQRMNMRSDTVMTHTLTAADLHWAVLTGFWRLGEPSDPSTILTTGDTPISTEAVDLECLDVSPTPATLTYSVFPLLLA